MELYKVHLDAHSWSVLAVRPAIVSGSACCSVKRKSVTPIGAGPTPNGGGGSIDNKNVQGLRRGPCCSIPGRGPVAAVSKGAMVLDETLPEEGDAAFDCNQTSSV